jgi:hypothetical protein
MRTRYRRDRLRRERPHTFRHPRQDKAALHQPRFIKRAGRLRPGFFQPKVDRLRASGTALVQVPEDSPHAIHNGKIFKVESMGTPGVKCRVSLLINEQVVDFTLTDVL